MDLAAQQKASINTKDADCSPVYRDSEILFVVFPFQPCPSGESAIDASRSFAVPALARRFSHQHIAGLIAVDAARSFAM